MQGSEEVASFDGGHTGNPLLSWERKLVATLTRGWPLLAVGHLAGLSWQELRTVLLSHLTAVAVIVLDPRVAVSKRFPTLGRVEGWPRRRTHYAFWLGAVLAVVTVEALEHDFKVLGAHPLRLGVFHLLWGRVGGGWLLQQRRVV